MVTDQDIVNNLIYNINYYIKWKLFSSSIWNWTQQNLNKNIILHHTNCISNQEDKFEQMKYVYEFIKS